MEGRKEGRKGEGMKEEECECKKEGKEGKRILSMDSAYLDTVACSKFRCCSHCALWN